MNVWKMNLKDNRDHCDVPMDLECSKFDFCKQRDIVGIGWADYSDNEDNTLTEKDYGYEKAKNSISSFENGDLVWVKNPETKEYYLCVIKSQVQYTNEEEFNKNDISMYCECEYKYIGIADKLPNEIKKKDLVSISTVSKVNEQLSKATVLFFNAMEPNLNIGNPTSGLALKHILKHKWIYTSVILAVIILLTLTIILVNNKHNIQEKEIAILLANKIFVSDIKVDEAQKYFYILKFNNDNEYAYGWVNLKENGNEIKK